MVPGLGADAPRTRHAEHLVVHGVPEHYDGVSQSPPECPLFILRSAPPPELEDFVASLSCVGVVVAQDVTVLVHGRRIPQWESSMSRVERYQIALGDEDWKHPDAAIDHISKELGLIP